MRHLRLNTFTAGACKRDGATLFLGCFRVEYAQLGKFYAFPVCPRLLVFHDMNMKPTMVSTAAIGGAGKPSLLDYSTTIGLVGGGILRI